MSNKEILKKRVKLQTDSKRKARVLLDRMKYWFSHEEAWNLDLWLWYIIYNWLLTYVADAENTIVRDDFELILKHAESIKEYIESDYFDIFFDRNDETLKYDNKSKKYKERLKEYKNKEKKFKEAMKWIADNFKWLWW